MTSETWHSRRAGRVLDNRTVLSVLFMLPAAVDPAVVLDLSARSRDMDGVYRCAGRPPGHVHRLRKLLLTFR